VKGIVDGCRDSDCQLLGGETAEMPGMYAAGEYDLAGFAVGSVKQNAVIDGSRIQAGDAVLALPSSGVHSNGFSLVRKVLEVSGTSLHDQAPWAPEQSIGLSLLTPTALYVRDVMRLIAAADVRGLVHITGGGFPENIPRVVPKGLATKIVQRSWEVPAMFRWLQEAGSIPDAEMFRTFNMGVGMVVVVPKADIDKALGAGVNAWVVGEIIEGNGVVMA
jgi:phosphoribosylformylglycinamidine cyclo-ligase